MESPGYEVKNMSALCGAVARACDVERVRCSTGSRRKRPGSGWCVSRAHWSAALSSDQSCSSPNMWYARAREPMSAAGLRRHSRAWRIGGFAAAPADDARHVEPGSPGATVFVSASAAPDCQGRQSLLSRWPPGCAALLRRSLHGQAAHRKRCRRFLLQSAL